MNKSTHSPRSQEAIAKEDALREPTPIITLPGYPEKFWDTTEPYMKSYPGSEPTLTIKAPPSRPWLKTPAQPEPVEDTGPAPMAESLRIRAETGIPPLTWVVATLAGIALGALAWIIVAVSI